MPPSQEGYASWLHDPKLRASASQRQVGADSGRSESKIDTLLARPSGGQPHDLRRSNRKVEGMPNALEGAVIGCLLGTAVGDAIGLPYEGLSPRRQLRLFPDICGHHFFFGRGMTSDDTEHTCLVAQALIVSGGEIELFRRELAWRLRVWLLGLPAGIGIATLQAIIKLWLGFPAYSSGVFSAGNGPAMRSAILGVGYGHDIQILRGLVAASTRITHTDPKAEYGALAVALAAYLASRNSEENIAPLTYLECLQSVLPPQGTELLDLVRKAVDSAAAGESPRSFAKGLGLLNGVSGYVYHTVPVCLHVWFRYQKDFRSAILEVVRCGGDTDTTAAIVGGIIGACVGKTGIPRVWLDGLWEWPRSVRWMERLGERLGCAVSQNKWEDALPLSAFGIFLRNVFFMLIVLFHGFRRFLPPY